MIHSVMIVRTDQLIMDQQLFLVSDIIVLDSLLTTTSNAI